MHNFFDAVFHDHRSPLGPDRLMILSTYAKAFVLNCLTRTRKDPKAQLGIQGHPFHARMLAKAI